MNYMIRPLTIQNRGIHVTQKGVLFLGNLLPRT